LAGLSTTEIGSPPASPATCSLDPASSRSTGFAPVRSPLYRAQAEESTLTRPKSMRPAAPSLSSCAGAEARRRNGCILREQGPRRSCSGCGKGTATLGAPLGGSGRTSREAESGKGDVHGYAVGMPRVPDHVSMSSRMLRMRCPFGGDDRSVRAIGPGAKMGVVHAHPGCLGRPVSARGDKEVS
jgi:hypothetical protein